MNEKKKLDAKTKPVHVIRHGEVVATICLRQSNAGYPYFDFTLNRCWNSMASGRVAKGNSFFEKHHDDIVRATCEAVEWIRSKLHSHLIEEKTNAADDSQADASLSPQDATA